MAAILTEGARKVSNYCLTFDINYIIIIIVKIEGENYEEI